MRKFACFTPPIVFAVAVLFLSSFAVAKGATVQKASVGQYTLQCALTPAPAAPDIGAVQKTLVQSSVHKTVAIIKCAFCVPDTCALKPAVLVMKNFLAIGSEEEIASVTIATSLKSAPATSSPSVVQDFECAIAHVAVLVPDIGATHQTVLSVVRT